MACSNTFQTIAQPFPKELAYLDGLGGSILRPLSLNFFDSPWRICCWGLKLTFKVTLSAWHRKTCSGKVPAEAFIHHKSIFGRVYIYIYIHNTGANHAQKFMKSIDLCRCEAEGINAPISGRACWVVLNCWWFVSEVVPGESKGMLISRLKQAMSET